VITASPTKTPTPFPSVQPTVGPTEAASDEIPAEVLGVAGVAVVAIIFAGLYVVCRGAEPEAAKPSNQGGTRGISFTGNNPEEPALEMKPNPVAKKGSMPSMQGGGGRQQQHLSREVPDGGTLRAPETAPSSASLAMATWLRDEVRLMMMVRLMMVMTGNGEGIGGESAAAGVFFFFSRLLLF
jgi:hypothetical protein